MALEIHIVVQNTLSWLKSSWHIHVPFAWLEACVQWIQEEAQGTGLLAQQQINQQVLDQWLLTDLRDLDYPVLPGGLVQAQKTELNGTFCLQVDSLLDVSQPAYSQLQKWRGTDCTNEEVSAVTQITQKPWEAKPSRMLLLQITDGVQSLEAMEYQPIPALNADLRPGMKVQLQGRIVCRLGMLLLGPSNIKILGGEVDDLVDRNNQGRMLCRTLGVPEPQQHQGAEPLLEPQQGDQAVEDLDLDDQELLASLEAQEEVERAQVEPVQESGSDTLSDALTQSSRNSFVRSHNSVASSRNEASTQSFRSSLTHTNRGASVPGDHQSNEEDSDLLHQEIIDDNLHDEDFPEEDFNDLPLEELDGVIFNESRSASTQSDRSHGSILRSNNTMANPNSFNRAKAPQTAESHSDPHQCTFNDRSQLGSGFSLRSIQKIESPTWNAAATGQLAAVLCKSSSSASLSSHKGGDFLMNDMRDHMDEDMETCFLEEMGSCGVQTEELSQPLRAGRLNQFLHLQGPCLETSNQRALGASHSGFESSHTLSVGQCCSTELDRPSAKKALQRDRTVSSVTLTSPPFTYLCLLQELVPRQHPHTVNICVKAFIVTLLGKLSSNNGAWRVCATISDGTGYLDVELSDEVLTGLLGFSVAEKAVLKHDPFQRGKLDAGMRRCQEELVDMSCVMIIEVKTEGRSVVNKVVPVSEKVLWELEQRVNKRAK
ncbi:recQ-mediated genome instability protein 1 [Thalassophryne amazonica]|uniref:recQ-mediated genome instability protein 1 n=1 Tax=Thalassophryne amazonica TaxID=390379 RepID=UPI0014721D08|nr:recQ-mediated genome instability protein 1 [Thalassophryne amazonica]